MGRIVEIYSDFISSTLVDERKKTVALKTDKLHTSTPMVNLVALSADPVSKSLKEKKSFAHRTNDVFYFASYGTNHTAVFIAEEPAGRPKNVEHAAINLPYGIVPLATPNKNTPAEPKNKSGRNTCLEGSPKSSGTDCETADGNR